MSKLSAQEIDSTNPKKKGAKSWQPSNLGDVIDKEPGYRYRWARKDEDNLSKKESEGWEYVNGVTNKRTQAIHPSSRPDEPHKMTSSVERRDGVLMRITEEDALARDAYHNEKVGRLEKRLYQDTKKDLGKEGASMHGSLTKEHKGVRTVIE